MCRLCGKKDETILHTSRVLIMEEIIDQGPIFNKGVIISSYLNYAIKNLVLVDDQHEAKFYMSSYFMDTIYGIQHFLGMNCE